MRVCPGCGDRPDTTFGEDEMCADCEINSLRHQVSELQKDAAKHPWQKVRRDSNGVIRFVENPIVTHIMRTCVVDMNSLATMGFSDADRAQFAQLIGYSVDGWYDLSYTDGC